jgi:folate-binding protein YgfZ
VDPLAVLIARDVVRASGPDTVTFLQGQLSQDVAAIPVGESAWSLLLAPTGKVDAWLRVTRTGDDGFELDVDDGFGETVFTRLSRFKLRTKCDFELRAAVPTMAFRGRVPDEHDAGARPIVWPGTIGADVIDPPGSATAATAGDLDRYEYARIAAGVPAMGRELTDATIPVEAGQWLIDASVSFTKGCFTGQELVARMDARGGNAPRPIRGVVVDGPAAVGDAITVDGKTVGVISSAAADRALAPVNRAVAPGTAVLVGARTGTVVELPMA